MVVQFARGARKREDAPSYNNERTAPRPRRTLFRMSITGLPVETSWQVSISPHKPGSCSCSSKIHDLGSSLPQSSYQHGIVA